VYIYPPVANFLQCITVRNHESWVAIDKVIAIIINSLLFNGLPYRYLLALLTYLLCGVGRPMSVVSVFVVNCCH